MTAVALTGAGPRLAGYRAEHRHLLTGPWLPGEGLAMPLAGWPALAPWHTVEAPEPGAARYGGPGVAVGRVAEVDGVHRRARVEIGVRPGAVEHVPALARLAVSHAFSVLHLHRVTAWVTPALDPPTSALAAAGFTPEVVIPQGIWFDGRPLDRAMWTVVDR
ncbi:GNAT family N-acetyltransferase [Actinokineospora sp.]|uniref:GNAT family N-acetyltransferase n=1 Tax=Actinokineospora sp. TaxID=1872133 RepID=UPI00403820B2